MSKIVCQGDFMEIQLFDERETKKPLNFSHDYYKLRNELFSTIRGKTKFKYYKIGDIINVNVNRKLLCPILILNKVLMEIADIDLTILELDAKYPGFEIMDHHDFVDLLNSFIPKLFNFEYSIHSEVSIFFCVKLPKNYGKTILVQYLPGIKDILNQDLKQNKLDYLKF